MSSDSHFSSPSIEELGRLIPAYEILELVSVGRRGALYKARQKSLDRLVTIKVLPPEIGQNPTLRQAFETEAKAMARLNHPNLVDVFDFGDVGGMLYIIMEDMPERNLHSTTAGHHVEPKESARLIADVCHGLAHAHEQGIVHRNLSPKSILISDDAEPKIVDFGLASLAQQEDGDDNPENQAYSAPETLDTPPSVDARSDIFAVGVMLYRLLTSHLPGVPYTPPSEVNQTHETLDEIIAKAIHPDPSERYQQASLMAADLELYLKKSGAAPTQALIRNMMAGSTTTGVMRATPQPTLASAKAHGGGGKIVALAVISLIIGAIAVVMTANKKKAKKESPSPVVVTPAPVAKKPVSPTPPKQAPKPKPVAPKPKPKPVASKPKPAPPVASTPKPKIAPPAPKVPDAPAVPDFDREAWLANARSVMVTKGRSSISNYDKELLRNIDRFERDVARLVRKLDRNVRKPIEVKVDEAFEEYRELGYIPEEIDKDAPEQIKKIYKEALADQAKIYDDNLTGFTRLRLTYLKGLDVKINQLKKEGNDTHAAALDEELELTQKDMARFLLILRGLSTDTEPEPDDKDKK
ncbi:hypothetical protein NT6N_12290 [Oceaniferula spumae]|uniref:Protein kinase domain-containing protein n=1 Tax=Oceaniferula spumae TaxID=2979115 RepID=A0AAT9FJL5_9BACT